MEGAVFWPLVLAVVGGYLLGSIPFGLLLTRAAGLGDIRAIGSGNIGATNVLRTGNKVLALATLLLDGGKGAVAVLLCRALADPLGLPAYLPAWAGAAAFAGHLFPVFLGFRGGKGVATFLGTLLALVPLVGVATCLLWAGVAFLTRYSSAASMVSAAAASLALTRVGGPPGAMAAVIAMSVFLIWRHRANIVKLLKGTESKIGQKSAPSGAAPAAAGATPIAAVSQEPHIER